MINGFLGALGSSVEDPGSIPTTHMAAHNCLDLQVLRIHGTRHACGIHTYIIHNTCMQV